MKHRRNLILGLFELGEGPFSEASLHRSLFLLHHKVKQKGYAFVPTKLGPWSFQLEVDLKKLEGKGWLERRDGRLHKRFASEDLDPLNDQLSHALRAVLQEGGNHWKEGVERVLNKDPFQGIRMSEAELEALSDPSLRERIEVARPDPSLETLFTIGYEGRPLEAYMRLLLQEGVQTLYDVRKDPLSRKFGFSKKVLKHACSSLGMCYEHLPALGIPKEERKKVESEADREALLDRYEEHILPQASSSLETLEESLQSGQRIALTCYEADSSKCHRSRISKVLKGQVEGISKKHL